MRRTIIHDPAGGAGIAANLAGDHRCVTGQVRPVPPEVCHAHTVSRGSPARAGHPPPRHPRGTAGRCAFDGSGVSQFRNDAPRRQPFGVHCRNWTRQYTLVIFTSDNGPWLPYGNHAGSAGPLREGKGTTWDGGQREPCLMRWPGRIPAGNVCREPAMTIDLLPTIANLAGAELPKHKIDGLDIWPLVSGKEGAKSPHEAYYYYWGRELQAVRSGQWKLHFPHKYRTAGRPARRQGRTARPHRGGRNVPGPVRPE